MGNGKAPILKTLSHFPFPIQAAIFQRPVRCLGASRDTCDGMARLFDGLRDGRIHLELDQFLMDTSAAPLAPRDGRRHDCGCKAAKRAVTPTTENGCPLNGQIVT